MKYSSSGNDAQVDLSPINSKRATTLTGRMVLVVFAAISGFVAWSATASLEEKAMAPGRIMPSGQVRTVQHLEGGIVDAILAKNGDTVKSGDVIVRLKRRSATAERDRTRARSAVLNARIIRLRAELSGEEPKFADPQTENARNELAIYRSRRASLVSERDVLMQQIDASNSRIASVEGEILSYRKRADLIGKEVDMRTTLARSGTGSRLELIKVQETLESVNTDIARLKGDIAQSRENIIESKTRVSELENRYRERSTVELAEANAQVSELREVAKGLEDRVERLEVTAPVHGVMQNLTVSSVGDVIAPGGDLAQIVPVDEELVADIEISPADIGFVRVGQPVVVKVNAFDYARFGAIDGELISVSATTFSREDGSVYYGGRVEVESNHVGEIDKGRAILPGMTLTADIRTGSKTIFEYMLKPIYTSLDQGFRER